MVIDVKGGLIARRAVNMGQKVAIAILAFVWSGLGYSQDSSSVATPAPPSGVVFKPTIGVGTGMFTYYGDISKGQKTNHPVVSRIGYDLRVTQPLMQYLDLNFYVLFGKLGANERSTDRNLNFESTVRMGGIALSYNFNHMLPEERIIDPYLMVGIESFEFLSKTDIYDANGNKYYYWSDGSIRNIDENSPDADQAIRLTRDYEYESDVRELNIDGFGDYQERSWAVPVGVGANLHVSERVKFRIGTAMHFTFTDLVDGVTDESIGTRAGDAANDKFLFTSFNINYQIGKNPSSEFDDTFDDFDFQGIDTEDEDLDLVRDFEDDCPGTNLADAGEVDEKGCPLDGDKDGVPDYRDDELDTPDSSVVNLRGVAVTDDMIAEWYNKYSDSTGAYVEMKRVEGELATSDQPGGGAGGLKASKKYKVIIKADGSEYELTQKQANDLLSMPGISRETDENGNPILVAGNYNDLNEATQRILELQGEGYDSDLVTNNDDGSKSVTSGSQVTGSTPVGELDDAAKSGKVVFRIQLGAFSRPLSDEIFSGLPQMFGYTSSEDGLTRYYTGVYDSYAEAAKHRVDMIEQGFEDAFIVSLKGGERVPLSSTGQATPVNNNVNVDEQVSGSASGSKASGVKFRVQVAAYADEIPSDALQRLLSLGTVDQKVGDDGKTKFVVGSFDSYEQAKQYATELAGQGNEGAFVVGEFNGKLIPSEEALELQGK